MSDLRRKVLGVSGLPPMAPLGKSNAAKKGYGLGPRDYSSLSWTGYFDSVENITTTNGNIFRIYRRGFQGPVCFFIHGAGFSALSWAMFSQELSNLVECQCVALDLRGHGGTKTQDDLDLSADTLTGDIGSVIQTMYGDEPPEIILFGHSLGGALAVRVASKHLVPSLIGMVVIDVVEGTALEALSSMQCVLRSRPKTFKSFEQATEWCVRSGTVRNLESARISMNGQVIRVESHGSDSSQEDSSHAAHPQADDQLLEEAEETEQQAVDKLTSPVITAPSSPPVAVPSSLPNATTSCQYTWRIDLSTTEKFWQGWFEGLSNMFLSCDIAKLLLLAGVDRLDKVLTVGQMQGKFQMHVLPQAGHAIHEDIPDKVAAVIANFLVRNKFTQPTANYEGVFPAC